MHFTISGCVFISLSILNELHVWPINHQLIYTITKFAYFDSFPLFSVPVVGFHMHIKSKQKQKEVLINMHPTVCVYTRTSTCTRMHTHTHTGGVLIHLHTAAQQHFLKPTKDTGNFNKVLLFCPIFLSPLKWSLESHSGKTDSFFVVVFNQVHRKYYSAVPTRVFTSVF